MEGERKRSPWMLAAVWLLVLVVIYALSFGPAVWLVLKYDEPHGAVWNFVDSLYTPLGWTAMQTGTSEWLESYLEWWLGDEA